MRSYSNWQHAQQMLTKKREALVKLELASKNEKLPQAQEEVKEVRKLTIRIEIWLRVLRLCGLRLDLRSNAFCFDLEYTCT